MNIVKYIAAKMRFTQSAKEVVLLKPMPVFSLKFISEVLAEKFGKKVSIYNFDSFEKYRLWKTEYNNGFQDKFEIGKGSKINVGEFIDSLQEYCLVRVNRVWQPGEFSLLGDTIVVWFKGEVNAVRIGLFGNEVEELMLVDPSSFKTVKKVENYVWGGVMWGDVEPDLIVSGGEEFDEVYNTIFVNVSSEKSLQLDTLDLAVSALPGGSALCANQQAIVALVNNYKNMGYDVYFLSSEAKVLTKGIVISSAKVAIITDYELYGELLVAEGASEIIKIGDYVVHEDHGIGMYEGLREQDGDTYMVVKYAGQDRLLIPLSQSARLSRYMGSVHGRKPVLTKLNGGGWGRTKNAIKSDVDLIAKELLQLYTVREMSGAHKILTMEKQRNELKKFVADFKYKDTYDQTLVTHEIISDLSGDKPMDRLLIGDVGFGKTEIAMRAAFAAVCSGYQVAVLAPTTVLVEQHKVVFKDRFKNFPQVKIKSFSRFNTTAEKNTVTSELASGALNIVIGTHSLLSDSVKFKNLALIVVDEEQRFGVKHKEKIKAKKIDAHVLSMSATPIPRTLNLSLSGIRDVSVIATPPENRVPIKNGFFQFDWDVVVEAVKVELERKGQVYFLHNRVADIQQIALKLAELLPGKVIDVAHGQMSGPALTRIMRDFAARKIDVLVCTTIIENGLDLPNVNTLIIDDIEKLGLSQMYQIRGRIGRSDRPAYAYFMYKSLHGDASLRLDALSDFQELGSGYLLSNRDMEIRGAGNILGDQQSGNINSVGYGLYMKMLGDAVNKYKTVQGRLKDGVEPKTEFVERIWLR